MKQNLSFKKTKQKQKQNKQNKLSRILQLFDLVWGDIWDYTVKVFYLFGALCVRLLGIRNSLVTADIVC